MFSTFKDKIFLVSLSTLLIFLPLNTVLVQFFVVGLGWPVWLTLWKEMLAGVLILISLWEILESSKFKVQSSKIFNIVNLPLLLISLMTLVGLVNSIGKVGLNFVTFGFRYELFWVWLWALLVSSKIYSSGDHRVAMKVQSVKIRETLLNSLLIGFGLVSTFSLITMVFGVENTLGFIGYGKTASGFGSDLLFTQPVGHLIDAGGWNSSFRLSGTFSSPNHFAAYLILLLPLFVFGILKSSKSKEQRAEMENVAQPLGFHSSQGKELEVQNSKFKVLSSETEEAAGKEIHPDSLRLPPLKEGNFTSLILYSKWFWILCLALDLIFLWLSYARFSYLALFVFFGVLAVVKIYNSKLQNSDKEIVLEGTDLNLSRKSYVRAMVYNPKTQSFLFTYFGKISGDNKIGLVGGSLDDGEDQMEALKREIIEETGYCDFKIDSKLGGSILSPKDPEFDKKDIIKHNDAYFVVLNSEKQQVRNFTENEIKNGLELKWYKIEEVKERVSFGGFYKQYNFFLERGLERVQRANFRAQIWFKNIFLGLIFAIPLLISVVVLNLPIGVIQTHFPSFLSKPSSTEWHQQHTAAAWRALTLQTHPETLNQDKLTDSDILKLQNLQQRSQNPAEIWAKLLTGYGMGTTDPASKYLPLEQNPIAKLGFGLDDELYFPRQIDRPLALTSENWFLGLWVKGGVFYMLLFLGILLYFVRHISLVFKADLSPLQNHRNMLKVMVSLSIFGLIIAAFLLDIFDSQSLALLIGPIYFVYLSLI
jgi:8-oxo-dGTP pyrophosphatase MutT (NUDIX family)